jgi:hypothetical protein
MNDKSLTQGKCGNKENYLLIHTTGSQGAKCCAVGNKLTTNFSIALYAKTKFGINNHKKIHTRSQDKKFIRGSANTAYIHRAHQIYSLYHKNEQNLTLCISHTLRKITLSVFLLTLRKIPHLYFSCSLLEKKNSLSFLKPFFSCSQTLVYFTISLSSCSLLQMAEWPS